MIDFAIANNVKPLKEMLKQNFPNKKFVIEVSKQTNNKILVYEKDKVNNSAVFGVCKRSAYFKNINTCNVFPKILSYKNVEKKEDGEYLKYVLYEYVQGKVARDIYKSNNEKAKTQASKYILNNLLTLKKLSYENEQIKKDKEEFNKHLKTCYKHLLKIAQKKRFVSN